MSYPPLPSNGETEWGNKFRAWADALEGRKVEGSGSGMTLRHDTSVGERVFLDHSWGSTMLYGNTGWRDVTPPLPDRKMTEGKIFIRRVNSTLMVWLRAIVCDEISGPQAIAAFDNVSGMIPPAGVRTTFDIGDVDLGNTDEVMVYGSTLMVVRWMGRKTTNGPITTIPAFNRPRSGVMMLNLEKEDWPTTLPGTPA